eukprot:maker-scaffold_7-snap-gene-15.37-mRNA-1 protein AED:0.00 eAED:0.00 QI:57/1/1/1/1/1/2/179/327
MNDDVLVLDVGSESIKIGDTKTNSLYLYPNFFLENSFTFRRPNERGCLVNKGLQESLLEAALQGKNLRGKQIVLVEHPLLPETCQKYMDEILFEKFKVASVLRELGPILVETYSRDKLNRKSNCSLVVDLGWSFTECVPVFDACYINLQSVKRNNVGSKLTKNLRSSILTYLDELEKGHLVDDNYLSELSQACYFNPQRIGLQQLGLTGLLSAAISSCPESFKTTLSKNIILTGGAIEEQTLLNTIETSLSSEFSVLVPKVDTKKFKIIDKLDRGYAQTSFYNLCAIAGGMKAGRIAERMQFLNGLDRKTRLQTCKTKKEYDEGLLL